MVKGGQSKDAPAKLKSVDLSKADAAALQAEVKSFASGLGLAAAGVSSGFDDSDFRPPAAGQKTRMHLSKPAETHNKQQDAVKRKPQADRQKPTQGRPDLAVTQQQAGAPDIVRERNWNEGVGPRPGEPSIGCSCRPCASTDHKLLA